jgi:hypothetical protein
MVSIICPLLYGVKVAKSVMFTWTSIQSWSLVALIKFLLVKLTCGKGWGRKLYRGALLFISGQYSVDYRQDNQGSKEFSSVQTSSEPNPAFHPVGTTGETWLGMMLTTYPQLILRSRISRGSYLPLCACMAVGGQLCFLQLSLSTTIQTG